MTRVIAVMSGKGGVGKTSTAVMLANILAENSKTIIIDFDLCGPSVFRALGVSGGLVKTESGFKPVKFNDNLDLLSFGSVLEPKDAVIWRGSKKLVFLELFYNSAVNYDYVIIDTPPGISEEHEFLVGKNIEVIVLTTPQNMSLNGAQRCIEFCKTKGLAILGVIENMRGVECSFCSQIDHPFGINGGILLCEEYSLKFLGGCDIESKYAEIIDTGMKKSDYKNTNAYAVCKKILFDLEII